MSRNNYVMIIFNWGWNASTSVAQT